MTAPDRVRAAADEWFRRNHVDGGRVLINRSVVEPLGVRAFMAYGTRYAGEPGQWWPKPSEVAACCLALESKVALALRWPSVENLLRHCASLVHLATKYGVDERDLRKLVRALKTSMRLAVAVGQDDDDGTLPKWTLDDDDLAGV